MQRTAPFIAFLSMLLCGLAVCSNSLQAQAPPPKKRTEVPTGFLPGYALNGHDTIRCKLAFDHSFPYPDRADQITIDFDGEVMTFEAADGLITGFGVQEAGKWFEYGLIIDGFENLKKTGYYAKKLVAGSIDLYEQQYNSKLYKPNAATAAGASLPASQTTGEVASAPSGKSSAGGYSVWGTEIWYYMAKYNANDSIFTNPIKLKGLRKEYLAPFISDYPALLEDVPEKFKRKELVRIVQEYNYWKGKLRMKAK